MIKLSARWVSRRLTVDLKLTRQNVSCANLNLFVDRLFEVSAEVCYYGQDKIFRRKRLSTGANFVHVYFTEQGPYTEV